MFLPVYSLSLTAETLGGDFIADWSTRLLAATATRGEHGFEALQLFVTLTLHEARRQFALIRSGAAAIVSCGFKTIWEGRIEDATITSNGLRIVAFGFWRVFADLPLFEFFVSNSVAVWDETTNDERAARTPELFDIDTNNRLHIMPHADEPFVNGDSAGLYFAIPDKGNNKISYIEFTYNVTLASSSWRAAIYSYTTDITGTATLIWSLAGNGATKTGLATVALTTPATTLEFVVEYTGVGVTLAKPTGLWFSKLTALSWNFITTNAFGSHPSASVTVDDVLRNILEIVAAYNGIISANAGKIETIGGPVERLELNDVLAIDALVNLGEIKGKFGIGLVIAVWEDRILQYYAREDKQRTWLVTVEDVSLQFLLGMVFNDAYAIFKTEKGTPRRTDAAANEASIAKYGVKRRGFITSETQGDATAEEERDVFLDDSADPPLKFPGLVILNAYPVGGGGEVHKSTIRPGDKIIVTDIPPLFLSVDLGATLIELVVGRQTYDLKNDKMTVEPTTMTARLDNLTAAALKEKPVFAARDPHATDRQDVFKIKKLIRT